jgi:hypothetical protein
LDDREVWTGVWPGVKECEEFGWYGKPNPIGPGYMPCKRDEPGSWPDLNRLCIEADWDRREMRYVRTNLTAAFAEMQRRGIIGSRGHHHSRSFGLDAMVGAAATALTHGHSVLGFAFYTVQGKWKMYQGKTFTLYFGQIKHPNLGAVGLSDAEVGKLVCECLAKCGVKYRGDGDPARAIRIETASIVALPSGSAGNLA